ncbi:hypothetical protein TL16_g02353 [Triparma laevis f. inornata]|uniref:Leucine-rich repeat-containing N-terminal plant-type domain-containing protein n=1 Tax=Triparma laevis f. inornata TaxID=1714386 RepID=A0A9W7DX37_9STRA|nr:hypothetical protein TL16_g02353 [Triparma laevis f. inornata]
MRPTGSFFDHVLEIQRPVVRASRSLTETVEANDVDRQALVDFYYSTNGEGWTDSSGWLIGDPCVNAWKGIWCHENGVRGTLSPTLFDLKNITTVILSGKANLKGALPSTLSTPSLTNIVIEGCSFTGRLPTTITSPLHSFYLAGNSFSSFIPPLPPTIIDVSLAYNQITGSIPPSFFSDTPNLKFFDVWHNKVGGSIRTSFSTATGLADLKLDLNDFSGATPSDISTWPIFSSPETATTVLFGDLWSCPVPESVREHSN